MHILKKKLCCKNKENNNKNKKIATIHENTFNMYLYVHPVLMMLDDDDEEENLYVYNII